MYDDIPQKIVNHGPEIEKWIANLAESLRNFNHQTINETCNEATTPAEKLMAIKFIYSVLIDKLYDLDIMDQKIKYECMKIITEKTSEKMRILEE